ncbi:hypothetical protein Ancab_018284, partial [Ancistrocladus abbreviatus]
GQSDAHRPKAHGEKTTPHDSRSGAMSLEHEGKTSSLHEHTEMLERALGYVLELREFRQDVLRIGGICKACRGDLGAISSPLPPHINSPRFNGEGV